MYSISTFGAINEFINLAVVVGRIRGMGGDQGGLDADTRGQECA